MKKNTRRARLQSLDASQLAKVTGGRTAEQYAASINMLELAMQFEPGSAWNVFFASAAEA